MAKKARKTGAKQSNAPVEKDDGTRWIVIHAQTEEPIYGTTGITKREATRLAGGLVAPATIRQV